jgi:hypothetical protein
VPSHKFSGETAALGEGASGLSIGDEIYGITIGLPMEHLPSTASPNLMRSRRSRVAFPTLMPRPCRSAPSPHGRALYESPNFNPASASWCMEERARSASTPSNSPKRDAHVITTVSPREFDFVSELGAA